jgi:hypothetical protein
VNCNFGRLLGKKGKGQQGNADYEKDSEHETGVEGRRYPLKRQSPCV